MVRSFVPALLTLALSLGATSNAGAYGGEDGAAPSLEERAMHLHTDRLRVEPGAADPQFDALLATPPLVWSSTLARAARFYADDMAAHGCFPADHSSCDGTSFSERVGGFYGGTPIGENIAQGQPSAEVAIYESWLHSEGHRANLLDPDWTEIGLGFAEDAAPLWVQDFGGMPASTTPVLTSATHQPIRPGPEAALRVFVAAHDPTGASLATATLALGDSCVPMEPDRGAAGMETWRADATASTDAGCVPYWIVAELADGTLAEYPTEGALLIPVDGADCAAWTATRPEAPCDSAGGLGGAGAGCGGSGEGYGPDANVGANAEYGSCAVDAGTRGSAGAVAVMALLARRRRG